MEPADILIQSRNDLHSVEKKFSVPQVIWCFWSGEPMNENRQRSFNLMKKHMGVPLCLVTDSNLHEFIVEGHPLHETYEYLSPVHKSDYLRIYLLHHYGGGWHDIKPTMTNYKVAWEEFEKPEVYLVGKPEIKGGPAKVYDENGLWMPKYWSELVATNRWIGKPDTPFSKELYEKVNLLLDEKSALLKKFPARHAYDKKKKNFLGMVPGSSKGYPLQWTVFGDLFHPLNYKYRKYINRSLPFDSQENLGLPYR